MSSLHILREDELVNYILCFRYAFLMLVITIISSGRMRSLHILSEDELENFNLFSLSYFLCWWLPQYPQGGWARYISSGRMSSRTIFCSPICPSLCRATLSVTMISSGRVSSSHILREDELENCILFLYTLCECEGGINKIILRDGGLFTYPQGGWALELCQVLLYTTLPTWSMGSLKSSQRMSKRPELCSPILLAKLEHPQSSMDIIPLWGWHKG